MSNFVTKEVGSIKFGIMNPSEIKKLSKVLVKTPEIYDSDGYPVRNGLMDPEMGVLDPGMGIKRFKLGAGGFGCIKLSTTISPFEPK